METRIVGTYYQDEFDSKLGVWASSHIKFCGLHYFSNEADGEEDGRGSKSED
jgi:hypothetical protein